MGKSHAFEAIPSTDRQLAVGTGRRSPGPQRGKSLWESPDYIREIGISGLASPRINVINIMGTLLHPSVPWKFGNKDQKIHKCTAWYIFSNSCTKIMPLFMWGLHFYQRIYQCLWVYDGSFVCIMFTKSERATQPKPPDGACRGNNLLVSLGASLKSLWWCIVVRPWWNKSRKSTTPQNAKKNWGFGESGPNFFEHHLVSSLFARNAENLQPRKRHSPRNAVVTDQGFTFGKKLVAIQMVWW